MIDPTTDSDREFADSIREEVLAEFDGDEALACECMAVLTAKLGAATAINLAVLSSRREPLR